MTEDILKRLREATGPDRDLDAEIETFACPFLASVEKTDDGGWMHPHLGKVSPPARYTASVDAALALVERKLPGKWTDILRQALWLMNKAFDWHICLKKPEQRNLLPVYILIALFTALQEKESAHE